MTVPAICRFGGSIPVLVVLAALIAAAYGCGGSGQAQRPKLPRVPSSGVGDTARNVVRVGGLSPADVAGAAVLAAYPPARSTPSGWVLVRSDRWREALLAAQFAAAPVAAGILP